MLHTLQVLYMWTLCDSTNINTIIEFVPNCSSMSAVMVSMAVLIRTFSSVTHTHPVSWNCAYHLRMELSDGGCFSNLVRNYRWTIVPRQSFWITLYLKDQRNGSYRYTDIWSSSIKRHFERLINFFGGGRVYWKKYSSNINNVELLCWRIWKYAEGNITKN